MPSPPHRRCASHPLWFWCGRNIVRNQVGYEGVHGMANQALFGRRTALRSAALGAGGLAAAALLGCGGSARPPAAPAAQGAGASKPVPLAGTWDYEAAAKFDGAPFPYDYPDPPGEPQRGGTYVLNMTTLGSTVATWDPRISTAGSTLTPQNTVTSRLLVYKMGPGVNKYTVELAPEMAQSWEQSPDGLTYVFKLARNAKFHNKPPLNGRPFTAKDVVNTFKVYADKSALTSNYLAETDSITAVDDYTLQIKMKEPFPEFIIPLAARVLPLIPVELFDNKDYPVGKTLIGTGSLLFENISAGGRWHFKANADYFQGRPYADGLDYYLNTGDPAVAVPAMRVGQIDMGAAISTKADADVLLRSNPDIRVNVSPSIFSSGGMSFNMTNPKFQDARVRRALSLSVDRSGYIQKVFGGFGKSSSEFGWPFVYDRHPTDAEYGAYYRRDIAEATRLLQAAGQANMEFEMICNTPVSAGVQSIQDDMRAAGVKVTLRARPTTEYFQLWATQPPIKGPNAGPSKWPDAFQTSYNGQTATANFWFNHRIRSDSLANHFTLADTQIDQWAAQQKAELNPQRRRDILRKMWDHMAENVYRVEIPAGFPYEVYGPRVRGQHWRGPYLAFYDAQDQGAYFHKTWLAQK